MYFFLRFDKNLLKIAAPTPSTSAKTIENNPYKTGTFLESSLTKPDTGPSIFVSLTKFDFTISSARPS